MDIGRGVRMWHSPDTPWHLPPYHLHPALDSNILFKLKSKLGNATNTKYKYTYKYVWQHRKCTHLILKVESSGEYQLQFRVSQILDCTKLYYTILHALVNIIYSLEPQILGSINPFHLRGRVPGHITYEPWPCCSQIIVLALQIQNTTQIHS